MLVRVCSRQSEWTHKSGRGPGGEDMLTQTPAESACAAGGTGTVRTKGAGRIQGSGEMLARGVR